MTVQSANPAAGKPYFDTYRTSFIVTFLFLNCYRARFFFRRNHVINPAHDIPYQIAFMVTITMTLVASILHWVETQEALLPTLLIYAPLGAALGLVFMSAEQVCRWLYRIQALMLIDDTDASALAANRQKMEAFWQKLCLPMWIQISAILLTAFACLYIFAVFMPFGANRVVFSLSVTVIVAVAANAALGHLVNTLVFTHGLEDLPVKLYRFNPEHTPLVREMNDFYIIANRNGSLVFLSLSLAFFVLMPTEQTLKLIGLAAIAAVIGLLVTALMVTNGIVRLINRQRDKLLTDIQKRLDQTFGTDPTTLSNAESQQHFEYLWNLHQRIHMTEQPGPLQSAGFTAFRALVLPIIATIGLNLTDIQAIILGTVDFFVRWGQP